MFVPLDDGSDSDMSMDVEPQKTVADLVQEWIDYYSGVRKESPNQQPEIILVEGGDAYVITTKKTKRQPSRTTQPFNREGEEEAFRQEQKKRRIFDMAIRQRKPIDYIGDDTMLERLFRFRGITNSPVGETTMRGRAIKANDRYVQDPYDYSSNGTWRNRQSLAVVTAPRAFFPQTGPGTRQVFDELYDKTEYEKTNLGTYSRAEIFLLEVNARNREKFKEILYGDTQLLMKLTPFINQKGQLIGDLDIQQIYNEIRIAYALNELLYNYSSVLSVHFMVMVDWFQTSRAMMGLFANPKRPTVVDNFFNQMTIVEYGHASLLDFLYENQTFGELRAVVFQVLHALETAWHTNEFIHGDLHVGNIQMKRTDYEESPFRGMNLLYKRRDVLDDWYVLRKEDLGAHIVKIIDFGFSRIFAPTHENHRLTSLDPVYPPHLHDKFVGLTWPENEMDPANPNRYTDVRMFFLTLFVLPKSYWDNLATVDRESFYTLASQVLDFDAMNRAIDATGFRSEVSNIRRYNAAGKLTPANLSSCKPCIDFLMQFGGYIRSASTVQLYNLTATDVLHQPFFDALRRPAQNETSANYRDTATRTDLVVSFIDAKTLKETQMLKVRPNPFTIIKNQFSSATQLSCAMCKGGASHYNMEADTIVPFCGPLCAEFKYVYNGKTVFR